MEVIDNNWIMKGVAADDPRAIRSVEALEAYVNKVGFLPLFNSGIDGFSVEEHTIAEDWWSGDPARDPWMWRQIISQRGTLVYGKFFERKAGFISLDWFPVFANYRRDGYDFDSLWEDGKASRRSKKIMDLFLEGNSNWASFEIKAMAGFGKDGEKGFDTTITELQMRTYLCMSDFRQKKNKKGEYYGWPTAVYARPEDRWGADHVRSGYTEEPVVSYARLVEQLRSIVPDVTEKQVKKLLG